jgi:hypothetical protein
MTIGNYFTVISMGKGEGSDGHWEKPFLNVLSVRLQEKKISRIRCTR